MRTIFSFSLFWLLCVCQAIAQCPLYNAEGRPSDALVKVLNAFGICQDGSWETIVQETQSKWLNGPHRERWEFEICHDSNPQKTYELFTDLSMTQSIWNKNCEYAYGVILGSSVQVMRQHFWFLKQAWEHGMRFKQLVILVGDRPLAPELENESTLIDPANSPYPFRKDWKPPATLPKNETEAAKLIFDQLDLPEQWRTMPFIFIDTPCPQNARRPNTSDTFIYWLKSANPAPGSCLIVSRQPFIKRQDAVAHHCLPPCFTIETVGEGFSMEDFLKEPRGTAILLDELARWIYEVIVDST